MKAIEIGCKKCGSGEFLLLDPKTGDMLCKYCRNRWVEPSLIQRTEAEIFRAEQANRPQVNEDNLIVIDKQQMDKMSKVSKVVTRGCLPVVIIFTAVVLILLLILIITINLLWQA